jgi:hypothetical protein
LVLLISLKTSLTDIKITLRLIVEIDFNLYVIVFYYDIILIEDFKSYSFSIEYMSSDNEKQLDRILAIDDNIRFAAISDLEGNALATKSRPGSNLYLSSEDTQDTLKHAASAWKSRMKHYDKVGKGLYTLAVYEKLRRATIPLPDGNILLVTIDNEGGQKQILDQVLNEVIYHDPTNPSG